jgi:hypothetical protein
MHRDTTTPHSSGGQLRSSAPIAGSGLNSRDRERAPAETEGFALTTFVPGEFEVHEPPDMLRAEV